MAHLQKREGHLTKNKTSGILARCEDVEPEPSIECDNCPEDCDGAGPLSITISGYSAPCDGLNGTVSLDRDFECGWSGANGGLTASVGCNASDNWIVEVTFDVFSGSCVPCSLFCSGTPSGSGSFAPLGVPCSGQVGTFVLS